MAVALVVGVAATSCVTSAPPKPLLEPPPMGQGFQMTTGQLFVEPGTELQICYFFKVRDLAIKGGLPPDESVILHRVQAAYLPGSHHMNIFRVRTIKGLDPANGAVQASVNGSSACSISSNWSDWPLIANSQQAGFDWTYPDGVGNELMPDETLMLQSHYVNASTQKTQNGGDVDVNFWVMPKADLQFQMGTLFATQQSIRICQSNPTPKFSGSCSFNSATPVHIIGANGHFHSRGKEFGMYVWDGVTPAIPPETDRFYTSDQWNEPPMLHSPDLVVDAPAKGGVVWTCSYQWVPPPPEIGCEGLNALDKMLYKTPDDQLDCCYTFGNTVDRAEHCNVFTYYYPKQDNVNCN